MSIINSQPLIGASGNQSTAYNLTRSLRFRSSASAYLNRTPASAGNRRTFTWSGWVKLGLIDANYHSFFANGNAVDSMVFWNDNTLAVTNLNGTSYLVRTTQVFRDPSAWYHLVIAFDTTQATASNRIKIYVNGVQITNFASSSYPSQNYDTGYNTTTTQYVAYNEYNRFDGYLAEVNFIDGQQLTPSDFGETDTATGVWKPKKYTGTYGTNGFYLKFDNLTSTSTLGNDSSGNSNTWTVNNISLTSGSTYDSMKDVPTLTDADTANYCVVNPLKTYLSPTISNGNLQGSIPSGATAWSTMAVSTGKWYFEATVVSSGDLVVGVIDASRTASDTAGYTASGSTAYVTDGRIRNNNSNVGTYATYTTGDVIGVAFDCDAPSVSFYKNNTLQATVTPTSGITYTPQLGNFNAVTGVFAANFGQRPFAYTPPSGFKALNTFNLPTPTIGATASTQANKYFDVALWTGNDSATQTISSLSFQPDFVWGKNRSASYFHNLYDAVRGAGSTKQLASNTTGAEGDSGYAGLYGYLSSFNSNGFTATAGTAAGNDKYIWWNDDGASYVAWNWKANGAGSSNTAGSISSTVSANTTAGFSIVTYTGDRTSSGSSTVGHGLGVAPSLIITKRRDGASDWVVQTPFVGQDYFLLLNTTAAIQTSASTGAGTLPLPTSTTFGVTYYTGMNVNGQTCVAYCFAEVAGYSKFGSYTGNGSTDGTFVFTGFRPKFVLIKDTTGSTNYWNIVDTTRNTYNVMDLNLYPNRSDAEGTSTTLDALSNGFKIRTTGTNTNTNGNTYIYMALAETPFKYSLGR